MSKTLSANDIVQADPGKCEWGPALVVVTDVRPWGIQGYTAIPKGGLGFIRLQNGDFKPTGGRAVWVQDRSPEEAR